MTSRTAGALIMVVGVAVTVAGIVRWSSSGSSVAETATPATITTVPTTSTTVATTTTTQETTTTTIATGTTESTTTTVPAETVEEFVPVFAAALASGDVDFVYSRLHPTVVSLYGEDLCRSWTEREIMALRDYRVTGPPEGPTELSVSANGAGAEIPDVFTVPIRFTFQGETFDTQGQFGLVDGTIHWLGECR